MVRGQLGGVVWIGEGLQLASYARCRGNDHPSAAGRASDQTGVLGPLKRASRATRLLAADPRAKANGFTVEVGDVLT